MSCFERLRCFERLSARGGGVLPTATGPAEAHPKAGPLLSAAKGLRTGGGERRSPLFEEPAARHPAELGDRPAVDNAHELDHLAVREPRRRSAALDRDVLN